MSDVMIQASGLSKHFGPVKALDNVEFEVRKGEVVGFLGPNGAGKSTTMRILTCFISPSNGSAKVHGYDVFDDPLEVRKHIGYLPQRAPLYQDMNVWEYLEFAATLRQLEPATFKTRLKKVVEVCGLAQVLGKPIGTLSHGYRQRVGLGQALIHDPPILILDEPTSDLDPNEKAELLKYIKEIGKDRTILLSTHNLAEVEESCARAIIVSEGKVVADGNLEEIRGRGGSATYAVALPKDGPKTAEVKSALGGLEGINSVSDKASDEGERRFTIAGAPEKDLRADIFKLAVDKGWTLLELQRTAQSLDRVFHDLTRGDERLNRGADWEGSEDDLDDDDSSDDSSNSSEKEEN
jgi:ABC-2 type transport system ATP-binding protein